MYLLTRAGKNANFPGSLHFQQFPNISYLMYFFVKSHNFPPNGQISREGAFQIPYFFQSCPYTLHLFCIKLANIVRLINIIKFKNNPLRFRVKLTRHLVMNNV